MRNRNKILDYLLYIFIFAILVLVLIVGYRYLSKQEEEINLNDNKELINYSAYISLNGATSVDSKKVSCTGVSSCYVHLPKATRKDGEVLGYSTEQETDKIEYAMDSDILLTENITLYVISYKVNKLTIDNSDIDYVLSREVACKAYNKKTECTVILPTFNKKGYENRGYSTTKGSKTGYLYPGDEYLLSTDKTLYPVYGVNSRYRTVNIEKTLMVNGSFIEIENGCSSDIVNRYLGYLNNISVQAPYLLFGNKISFLVDTTFDNIWGTQYVGMNYGPRKLRAFDMRCSNAIPNDYYATMVHELSHSWDFYYSIKFGDNITSSSDVVNLFNKYSKDPERPFRDYSYTSIYEFFADMSKYYYFKYTDVKYEYARLDYPEDIKKVMEKYICIAKNNYDDTKCK